MNDLPFDLDPSRLRVNLGDLVADQEMSLVIAVAFKGSQQDGASIGVECRMVDRRRRLADRTDGDHVGVGRRRQGTRTRRSTRMFSSKLRR